MPQCKSDGSFKEKQCHSSTGQCWCVDQNGHEWSGTRTRGDLDCTTSGISRLYWQKFANFSHKHEKCIFWLKISLKCMNFLTDCQLMFHFLQRHTMPSAVCMIFSFFFLMIEIVYLLIISCRHVNKWHLNVKFSLNTCS